MRLRLLWISVVTVGLFIVSGGCGNCGEDPPESVGPDGADVVDADRDGAIDADRDGVVGGDDTDGGAVDATDADDRDADTGTDSGCDYNGNSKGVCADSTVNADGTCQQPADYESREASCDNEDNDCDGVVDEGCFCDYKNSSEGVCGQATKAEDGTCQQPADWESDEALCDAKDNDCDGDVDENCTCTAGNEQSCYTGPSGTAGTGECAAGTRTCQSDQTWGDCTGDTTPSNETCDGKDNDCDGTTDEGCSCNYNGTTEGVCSDGTLDSNGNCSAPGDWEQDESSCDGKDNDCDGVVDEGCFCDYDGTSEGVCSDGTIDSNGDCQKPTDYESDETSCDAKDNDCDGTTDENCACNPGDSETCYTGPSGTAGTGVCTEGSRDCQSDGSWGSCMGETTPSTETCDGKDNDCDGTTDEGCSCDYKGKSAGVCQNQTIDENGNCPKPKNYEDPESTCSDGLDNDCDGDADCGDGSCDGVQCNGSGTACKSGDGVCHEVACSDNADNDGDNGIDACDPNDCSNQACAAGAICIAGGCAETNCEDGNDNDGDGAQDCADQDCHNLPCGTAGKTCCPSTGDCRSPRNCN